MLPRPPGISSVFSARRFARIERIRGSQARAEPIRKYVWSRKPSVVRPSASAARADAREVDVGRDVLLAGVAQPRRRVARRLGAGHRVPRERRQRAGGVRRRVELARLVAVVDQDDEAAPQPPRRLADPVDRAQVDLGAPARLERDAQPRRDTRQAPASTADLRPSQSPERVCRCGDVDVHLAQAVLAHHDLMHRQRVEQLVGDAARPRTTRAARADDEASRSADVAERRRAARRARSALASTRCSRVGS